MNLRLRFVSCALSTGAKVRYYLISAKHFRLFFKKNSNSWQKACFSRPKSPFTYVFISKNHENHIIKNHQMAGKAAI